MIKEQVNSKEVLLKQISLIDEYFNKNESIPYEEAHKLLLLVGMLSKIKEKESVSRVSDLKVRHNCYHTLQLSYRIVSKEASFTLDNVTDDNIAIILGQVGILGALEEHLESEDNISLPVLNKMNEITVTAIGESAKKFRRINGIKSK